MHIVILMTLLLQDVFILVFSHCYIMRFIFSFVIIFNEITVFYTLTTYLNKEALSLGYLITVPYCNRSLKL